MGINRLLKKANPFYQLKEIVVSTAEEESLIEGYKKVARETYVEDMPGLSYCYNQGVHDGKKEGYVQASGVYENKFIEQSNLFLQQTEIFEEQREEYESLLDEYDKKIFEYEIRLSEYSLDEIDEANKNELLQLFLYQHNLEKLKHKSCQKISQENEKHKKLTNTEMYTIVKKATIKGAKGESYYYTEENFTDRMERFFKDNNIYVGEEKPVMYYNPTFKGAVMDRHKEGVVFGIRGLFYIKDGRSYYPYNDISSITHSTLPPGLMINTTDHKKKCIEGIAYAESEIIDIFEEIRKV